MAAGGGRGDRGGRRPGRKTGKLARGLRTDRSALLAVSLSLVTLLSVVTVPVAGADLAGAGAVTSVDDGAGAGDPLTKGGPPADKGQNGGSAGGGSSPGGGSSGGGAASSSGGGAGGGASDSSGSSSDGGDDGDGDESDSDGSDGGTDAGDGGDGDDDERTTRGSGGNAPASKAGSGSPTNGGGPPESADDGDRGKGDRRNGARGNGARGGGPPGDGGPPEHTNAGGKGQDGAPGQSQGEGRGPPDHANGESRGDGPSVSVSTGDRGAGASSERSGDGPPPSVVEVSVTGAEAGDDVDLDVSPASVEDEAVAFEGIAVTVKRGGDFTMRVTNSRDRLPGSPEFEPDGAAESLGRIRLDHSISNEEVEEVSYTFRVSKEHLRETGTDFEDVALYRHANGRWSELPTDVVGETRTHYLLSADSPGMSEFAVGAKRPDFDAYWADVDRASVDDGEAVTVSGRVANTGGADGVYDARLRVDGEVVAERSVTIAAGGTRQVNFRTTMDRPGERRVTINGVAAGEVTVDDRPAESSAASTDRSLSVVFERLLDVGQALGIVS